MWLDIILALIPVFLLVVGVVALAAWAVRQRDSESALIDRLTGRKKDQHQQSGARRKPPA